ncbi:hypothetical protein BJX63DRAFT_437323 [Aspergillus granulosus]|uniref:Uncharacterized protein n=1 Tax=Aspergillus granulosus TaxID=176169 RepID=A0ABR4GVB8_9EURO
MSPLGECTSLTKFKLIPENVLIPTHLDQIVPDDLRLNFNFLRIHAGKAFRAMMTVVHHRQNRFRALCPSEDKVRQSRHIATINRLKLWCKDHDMYDPTLAPSQKIPQEVIYLCVRRTAYEEWAERYANHLSGFINGPYQQYRLSAEGFGTAIWVARERGRVSHLEYHELMIFYETFMREMTIWEEIIPHLELPGYEDIVYELFEAVLERVENGERLLEVFQRVSFSGEGAGK